MAPVDDAGVVAGGAEGAGEGVGDSSPFLTWVTYPTKVATIRITATRGHRERDGVGVGKGKSPLERSSSRKY